MVCDYTATYVQSLKSDMRCDNCTVAELVDWRTVTEFFYDCGQFFN